MRYEGKLYRPPSEADAYILQATIGCSWNHCTYCDMYREKSFRVRDVGESLADLELAARVDGGRAGAELEKLFVADGDALVLPMDHWRAILARALRVRATGGGAYCYLANRRLHRARGTVRSLGADQRSALANRVRLPLATGRGSVATHRDGGTRAIVEGVHGYPFGSFAVPHV